jgi:hypothetical protein
VFSLQRILGHTSLDMVKRNVALADVDLVTRHALASPSEEATSGRSLGTSGALNAGPTSANAGFAAGGSPLELARPVH